VVCYICYRISVIVVIVVNYILTFRCRFHDKSGCRHTARKGNLVDAADIIVYIIGVVSVYSLYNYVYYCDTYL
jgi:hypothetical protein